MTAAAPHTTLTIGTRASRLALWQTGRITELIESAKPGVVCRAVRFTTAGDKQLDRPLPEIGGKGVFTQELEDALHDGRIDLAVHSLKDLPTAQPDGLVLGAICERADARDVLVSRERWTLESLPEGARIGTSSPRRRAQLLAARDDLEILPLRGNIDTRVRKALDGDYDAIVVAAAGVERLELTSAIRQHLPFEVMLPAPGQGALAVQCRAADTSVRSLLQSLDDTACRAAVSAERAFLEALGGGCSAPVGAYACAAPSSSEGGGGGTLHLRGIVVAVDGSHAVRVSVEGLRDDAAALGRNAAQQALAEGAGALLP
ncbi:MAG: hydroxymethylbilane synthase [Gemmatimonadetes bacterium]|nr:hydroxymethylbilane synthase [Gemmatimonadota bacterium]